MALLVHPVSVRHASQRSYSFFEERQLATLLGTLVPSSESSLVCFVVWFMFDLLVWFFPYLVLLLFHLCYIVIYICYMAPLCYGIGLILWLQNLMGKTLYPSLECKHKIGRWLSSVDSRGEYLVRVSTRTLLRVDPLESVVTRQVFGVSFNVS